MTIFIEQTKYETIPTGNYVVTLAKVEEDDGQFGPQIKCYFVLADTEHAGTEILGWCSRKFNRKSKLFAWTQALTGKTISPDYHFQEEDVINKKAMATIIIKTKDDGGEFNKIDSLRAYDEEIPY